MADEEELEKEETPKIELTPREIAIAKGEDPDAIESSETGEESVTEDGGTDAGATDGPSKPEPWVDDEARELAASYGLSEEDLGRFPDKAAFEAAGVLFDRSLKRGKKEEAPEPKKEEAKVEEKTPEDDLDLEKLKETFDDDTVALVGKLKVRNESLRGELEKLRPVIDELRSAHEQSQKERDEERSRNVMSAFHGAMDKEDDGLFGRFEGKDGEPVRLSSEHDAARRRVFEAAQVLTAHLIKRAEETGEKVPMAPVILRRAIRMEFGDELDRRASEKRRSTVKEQSKARRPVARGKAVPDKGSEAKKDEDRFSSKAILTNPEMQELLKSFDEEAGRR